MSLPRLVLAIALLALPQAAVSATESGPLPLLPALESDWIANAADHICGLSSLRALSDPAKVDYPHLWDATPEIRKMKEEGIDPRSAEGIQLQQEATDRILEACKEIQEEQGLCSVWKEIRHKDGRTIPDITSRVEAEFSREVGSGR